MWTNEQKIKIRNTIANNLQDSGLMNYSLRVEEASTSPDSMATISFDFKYSDLKDGGVLIQITESDLVKILEVHGLKGFRTSDLVVSVFQTSIYYHLYIHFRKDT